MPSHANTWSRKQLLVAFNLYCQLPFGKLHAKNPLIVKMAHAIGRTPSALAMKLTNIASLDPAITSSGRVGLAGSSRADRAMWEEMQGNWEEFAIKSQAAVTTALTTVGGSPGSESSEAEADENCEASDAYDYTGTDRTVTARLRVGQQFFRKAVLSAYQSKCCISGLSNPRLLVASHIVPWRSDSQNRLNPRNGLCLSALHDKAFDQGLFTLTDDFTVKLSREIKKIPTNPFIDVWLLGLDGKQIALPEKFRPMQDFVAWHRSNVFLD